MKLTHSSIAMEWARPNVGLQVQAMIEEAIKKFDGISVTVDLDPILERLSSSMADLVTKDIEEAAEEAGWECSWENNCLLLKPM